MTPSYTFLPWLRRGLAASVSGVDPLRGALPERAPLAIRLAVNDEELDVPVHLHGAGDVAALEPSTILATTPRTGAATPWQLAAVHLSLPDLPWLLTPAQPDAQGRLRPWLVLVVVREQPGVSVELSAGSRLPALRIEAPAVPAEELPDLAESWAWAHVRVVGEVEEPLDQIDPRRMSSTLLCPRRLEPGTRYLAALVPAFDAGRRAGLGEPADDDVVMLPAWSREDAEVRLPTYHHWRFVTDDVGDFETLAERLRPRPVPAGLGSRALRIDEHSGLGPLQAHHTLLEGALQPPGFTRPAADPDVGSALQARLQPGTDAQGAPLVTPPLYGGPAVGATDATDAEWLAQLNLDPRFRVAAGLGTAVVRQHQEQLVGEAWRQLGQARRAQRRLLHAQVSRFSSAALFERHVATPAPDQTRPPLAAPGRGLANLSLRRLSGSTSGVMRRVAALHDRPVAVSTRSPPPPPRGHVTLEQVHDQAMAGGLAPGWDDLSPQEIAARPPQPRWVLTPAGEAEPRPPLATRPPFGRTTSRGGTRQTDRPVETEPGQDEWPTFPDADTATAAAFRAAAQRHQAALYDQVIAARAANAPPHTIAVPPLPADPQAVLVAHLTAQIQIPPHATPTDEADPLAPLHTGPVFEGPTLRALLQLDADAVLPGLRGLPDDSVTLLEANPAFVQAFLVGLNHELARELLWRDYPVDPRATAFRNFWARRADIGEISGFDPEVPLGGHTVGVAPAVVVLRGELVRRFPSFAIYAVPATWIDGQRRLPSDTLQAVWPLFEGHLDPATRFVGLEHDVATLTGADDPSGSAGFFFVLEEAITAPRFGLDAPRGAFTRLRLGSWDDLSWDHVGAASHCPIDEAPLQSPPGPVAWGHNAAHMAHILLQRPSRVLVHARDLLSQDDPR